ncbi:MAG: succinate dehydrogenase, hydrophobic membrane anchor protein [Steroidobacterales bacterium]
MSLRTPLARVLNHGAARDGVAHWWVERVSALALVPLVIWLLIALLRLPLSDYGAVAAWIGGGWNPVLLGLLVLTACRHSQLGLEVVIEDYVRHGWKTFLLLLSTFIHVLLAAGGVYAVLRIALRMAA